MNGLMAVGVLPVGVAQRRLARRLPQQSARTVERSALDLPGGLPGHMGDLALYADAWPGSGQAADLMLVPAEYGEAHIIFRADSLSAARTNPPAGVQFVAFQVNVRAQEMLFG
jgi:hypothetical protein